MNKTFSDEFLKPYQHKQPKWGFNGLGYIVYKRTYARTLDDGASEEWWQTVRRCIEGAQKIGAGYTKPEMERLYDYVFNLKCNFAGRSLWQLGTSAIEKIGGNSLVNCLYCSLENLEDFCFVFENLLLGGGVGVSVRREHIHTLPKIKEGVKIEHIAAKDTDFIVPDSRSGWVELLRKTLQAYFVTGKGFTYSTILVRGEGEPIKTFGGTASGPRILVDGITKICNVIKTREGKKLRSLETLDVCNIIASIVVAGNVRRSSMITLGDSDDYLFLRAKRWDLGHVPNWRAMSNNTIAADKYSYISNDAWEGFNGNGETYGLFNLPLSQSHGRLIDGPMKSSNLYPVDKDSCTGTNPCITGDTLVYVADGRGNVPIRELAQQQKDVPVFCFDQKKNLAIRYMRNPRLTGQNVPVYKLHLEDGIEIKTTGNHKFLLSDHTYKQVTDLKNGDSLKLLTRYEASFKEIFKQSNSRSSNYLWLSHGQARTKAEHRLIAEFFYNTTIQPKQVVHHWDYNTLNNDPQNLKVLTKEEHDNLHTVNMLGDKNPMRRAKLEWTQQQWTDYRAKHSKNSLAENNKRYSGYTHEELQQHALILTKQLQRRFSSKDWQAYAKPLGLPTQFSSWRVNHLGSVLGLASWAAAECLCQFPDADPRTQQRYLELTKQGYHCKIENRQIVFYKNCELCGTPFVTTTREAGICNTACRTKHAWKNQQYRANIIEKKRQLCETKRQILGHRQLQSYTELKFQLQRNPLRKEWQQHCKYNQISCEISRKSSPFRSYAQLQQQAEYFNHRIISVEFCGVEEVYNGTVDDFHNFFIGGIERKTVTEKRKWLYFNNLQCGEISLPSYSTCNLAEIYLNNIDNKKEFIDCAKLLYKTQKAICGLHYLHDETNKIVHKEYRIGLGVTGICQSQQKLDWLNESYKELRAFDKEWSKEQGLPKSIKLTTVKPSGTLSLLGGSSPGVHPAYAKYYIRRVRMSSSDKLIDYCKKLGYKTEYLLNFDKTYDHNTTIIEFPCFAGNDVILAKDVTAVQQLELIKKLQTEWSDNAVSCTVYFKKEELADIKKWLKEHYEGSIKSVSFLLHSDHGFSQPPYEEITKEQYEEYTKHLKEIKPFNADNGTLENMECISGACPIK